MIEIPLHSRRGVVLAITVIDDADAECARHRWFLCNGYVMRCVRSGDTLIRPRLHREVMGLTPDDPRKVDHIDRDPLNNRRSNLRIATIALNAQNKPSMPGSSSRYRGVTWDREKQKWLAQAKLNGRNHYIGRFVNEEDAAAAASEWRRTHMPFAVEVAA